MNEYISKQSVIDYLNGYLHSIGECGADSLLFDRGQRRALVNSIQDISAVKAAPVAPVKHGHWRARMSTTTSVKCTCCNCYHEYETPYCPNCGAKMDKGSEINGAIM